MREGPLRARRQQMNTACAGKSCMRFAVTSPLLSNRSSCIECQKDRTDVPRTGLLRPREVLFQEYSLPRNMRARKQRCFSTSGTARSFSNTSIRRLPLKQQLLLKQDSSKQSFGCIGHILVASKIDPKSFKNCPITQEQTKVCRMQRIYWVVYISGRSRRFDERPKFRRRNHT